MVSELTQNSLHMESSCKTYPVKMMERRDNQTMKSTGIVRKVDPLGRVVIPIELRRTLNINEKDPLEIYVANDRIILRKYESTFACVFCGNVDSVTQFRGKRICGDCLKELPSR